MRLRTEVVHLSGLDLGNDVDKVRAVAEIAVVELEFVGAYTRVREAQRGREG